jgi:GxxExxY protein
MEEARALATQVKDILMPTAAHVMTSLGPGYCEGVYHSALVHNLSAQQHVVSTENAIPIAYVDVAGLTTQVDGNHTLRTDVLWPAMKTIIELKASAKPSAIGHFRQALRYMSQTTPVVMVFAVVNFISPGDATTPASVQVDLFVRSACLTRLFRALHLGPFVVECGNAYCDDVDEDVPVAQLERKRSRVLSVQDPSLLN